MNLRVDSKYAFWCDKSKLLLRMEIKQEADG
jgi:hypothetical protein